MNEVTARSAPALSAEPGVPTEAEPSGNGRVRRSRNAPATERAERIAERMGNVAATWAFASTFINFILVGVIFVLVQKPPSVFLLHESDGKFYQARGPVEDANVLRTLMEKFSRRYVLARETVNLVDDTERFEWVQANSTKQVWSVFQRAMSRGGYYEAAVQNNTTWSIKIVAVWQSNDANPGVWSVEIQKQHYSNNRKKGAPEAWIIELRLSRDANPKTPQQQLDNPAALYVDRYSAKASEAVKGTRS